MAGRLTDQAAVAVAVARATAPGDPTVGHLLIGLATESEGRAGRRLRERATAVARLIECAGQCPAPPLDITLSHAATRAEQRAISTVDLLDAAVQVGGEDVSDLLDHCGYQRDLDGWLTAGVDAWFDDAETLGWSPAGDEALDPVAARVAAQVRAVGGGAVEVLIAAAAAPELADTPDPLALAWTADRLERTPTWDAGLDSVVAAAVVLADHPPATVRDLLRAALLAGGDGPQRVLEAAEQAA